MKSEEPEIPGVREWSERLSKLEDEEFLAELSTMSEWPWTRQDSLSEVSPVLDRIDLLLESKLSDATALELLLSKSVLMLKNAVSKQPYPSLEKLSLVLDNPSWRVVFSALEVVQQLPRLNKQVDLVKKLSVIGMGNFINNPNPCSLASLCGGDVSAFGFHWSEGGVLSESSAGLPESLQYALMNRERANAVKEDPELRQLSVACQLLAVTCFVQASAGTSSLAEFKNSLPEVWLLPGVVELLSVPASPLVHAQTLSTLAAMLTTQDKKQRGNSSLFEAVCQTLEPSQPSGLFQTLLSDVAVSESSLLSQQSANDQNVIESTLTLASVILSIRQRTEVNARAMTSSLLSLLRSSGLALSCKEKAVLVLTELISHSISAYKELNGAETVLDLISGTLRAMLENPPRSSSLGPLLKASFKLLSVSLPNWDPVSPTKSPLPRLVMDSGLPELLRNAYLQRNQEAIEGSTSLISALIMQNHELIVEMLKNHTLSALFEAFEGLKIVTPKLIASTVRLLCAVSLHPEGTHSLPSFNIVSQLVQASGSFSTHLLSNEEVRSIGEGFAELMSLVPDLKDTVVTVSVSLLKSLPNISASESFATQLSNIAKTLGILFSNSQDLTKLFIEREGFECFLNLFKLPTLPLSATSEYHLIAAFLKSIPQSLMSVTLGKILGEILQQIGALEDLVGPLASTESFIGVSGDLHDRLLHTLAAIDAYTEMARFILQNSTSLKNNVGELRRVVNYFEDCLRILIAEQVRLSPLSQASGRCAELFDVPLDLKEFENQESKSFEEQFYFNCQHTLTKLLKFIARIPSARSRSSVPEDVGVTLSDMLGKMLATQARRLNLERLEPASAFVQVLGLSDLLKILFNEQGASAAVFHVFSDAGGLEHLGQFVNILKEKSAELYHTPDLPYELVHFIQLLWSLCGKCFEGLVAAKFAASTAGGPILKALGVDGPKEVARQIKLAVMDQVARVRFLDCAVFSSSFASSMFEVMKQLSDLHEDNFVDPTAVAHVVEMGFPEFAARQALIAVGTPSVELATEWILNHPEVFEHIPEEETPTLDLANTHQVLINSIPALPTLYNNISDVLGRMAARPDAPYADIALMLLTLTGKLAAELLQETALLEVTQMMSSLDPVKLPPAFDQLNATLHVLASLCTKNNEVFEIVKGNEFAGHACTFLRKITTVECNNHMWVAPLFNILDCLVRNDRSLTDEIVEAVTEFARFNAAQPVSLITSKVLLPLIRLIESLSFCPSSVEKLVESGLIKQLLVVRVNEFERLHKQLFSSYSTVLRQLAESPDVLQCIFELRILSQLKEPKQLERFIKDFNAQAARDDEVFQRAFKNTTVAYRTDSKVYVKAKADWKPIEVQASSLICMLADALVEVYEIEQSPDQKSLFSSEDISGFMGELLQSFPLFLPKLLGHSNTLQGNDDKFWRHLLMVIIPLRHAPPPSESSEIEYSPHIEHADAYQSWIKSACRLIKACVFRQNSPLPSPLQNNNAVHEARKLVFKELKEMLVRYSDLRNSLDVCKARTLSIVVMQILRETSKAPYSPSNQAEIAKTLISFDFISTLVNLAKGINLHYKKASSFLNLVLSPLELLLQYNINFTLHAAKQQGENLESINQEIAQRVQSENSLENSEEEDQGEMEDEFGEDDRLEDIILESRNTEAFWAENFEEEEQAYPPFINREGFLERFMPNAGFDIMQEEPNPHFIFDFDGRPPRDMDERYYMMQLLNMENHPDMIQYFMQRRQQQREEVIDQAVARQQVPNYAFDNMIIDIAENAQEVVEEVKIEEPAEEEVPEEVPEPPEPVVQEEINEPVEEQKDFVPEGLDPEVFDALPEDLRNEILAQYRPPPAPQQGANISEDFLAALPDDMRAEVLNQNRPPPQAEEIDAASFIASLAPDLRREVLLTASEEVLNNLPPDILAEARVLQDRISHRHLLGDRGQAQPKRKDPVQENKAIAEISGDTKLSSSLIKLDDKFIEHLLRCYYMANPVSKEILTSLLLCLSAQANNRKKIIDGLSSMLMQLEPRVDFPIQHMTGSEILLENYSQVYAIVALRVIETLQFMCTCMPNIGEEFAIMTTERLPLINLMREAGVPFKEVISLLGQALYRTSSVHLESLIKVLAAIVDGQNEGVVELDGFSLSHICSLLSFKSLNEGSVRSVIQLVKNLAKNEQNRLQIGKTLSQEAEALAEEVTSKLNAQEMDMTIEMQLLRICKVLKSVEGKAKLSCMWGPLTEALQVATEGEFFGESTLLPKLFPLLETFFISNAGTVLDDEFYTFCENNKGVINSLVEYDPSLLNSSFSSLVSNFPSLLTFKNKQLYFQEEVKKMRSESAAHHIRLNVRRNRVFMDSYNQLKVRSAEEMMGRLRIQFAGEEGMDAGGLTREWYTLLAKEIFNPDYALFIPSANGASFQPNSMSAVNRDTHLLFFRFVGRFIGKAICDFNHLDVYFTRSFYKHILGQEISYQDVEDLDPEFFNSLKKLQELNLDESDLHEYYFVYEEEEFGRMNLIELVDDGKNTRVTEGNKQDYINHLCHMKMTRNIQAQIDAFLSGFYEIVPKRIISVFDAKELELFISGLPSIDLTDLYENTDYHNYTRESRVIVWLWETLEEFTQEERAGFIQFVTGSSKVPLEGFKVLPGMGGIQKFQIHKSFVDTDRLPTSHTCMNQLDLPDYPSKQQLSKLLRLAITEGKEGFGFI